MKIKKKNPTFIEILPFLLKAYIKKSGKTLIFSFLFGLVIFFTMLFAVQIFTSVFLFGKTLISGLVLFVLGQIINKLYIDPMIEFRKTKGRIHHALKFYANIYTASSSSLTNERADKASEAIRNLSCEIEANYMAVPNPIRDIFLSGKGVNNVSTRLMFLSNNIGIKRVSTKDDSEMKNYKVVEEIRKLLKIKTF